MEQMQITPDRPSPLRQSTSCAESASTTRPAEESPLPAHAKVLAVDDVVMNGKLVEFSIHKFIGSSWEVTSVCTPEAALEAARATPFDLILMDEVFSHDAGSMRGSDAVREIRNFEASQGDERPRAIVVMCSGNVDVSDEAPAAFMEAGADAVWSKPIPSGPDGSLAYELSGLFAQKGGCAPARSSSPHRQCGPSPMSTSLRQSPLPSPHRQSPVPVPSPLRQCTNVVPTGRSTPPQGVEARQLPAHAKVLIADDVTMNLKLFELALHKFIGSSWEVTSVSTPEAALEAACATPFDLILMDEVFSRDAGSMRGSDAVRAIRGFEASQGDERPRAIVVMCSGCDDAANAVVENDPGVDAVWAKPFPSGPGGELRQELEAVFYARDRAAM